MLRPTGASAARAHGSEHTVVAAALLGIGLLVGVLIGAIGVGGVLLVPVLTYIGGIEIHVAIASAMVAYFFAGGVGSIEFSRQGSIRWSDAAWLGGGAMPGAFAGAAATSVGARVRAGVPDRGAHCRLGAELRCVAQGSV